MWLSRLIASAWLQDGIALVMTMGAALAFLRVCNLIASRRWLPEDITRKLVHIGTGPLYLLCWPLFSETWHARWAAVIVPAILTAVFALVGLGVVRSEGFVASMSRSGDRRELLRGPLIYGAVFVAVTAIFWVNSPIGIAILMLVCGGDGLADVVGRRLGHAKLPGQALKSWAGSLAFLLGGLTFSIAYMSFFGNLGYWDVSLRSLMGPLLISVCVATLVEAYSPSDLDNLSVPVAALASFWLVLPAADRWMITLVG